MSYKRGPWDTPLREPNTDPTPIVALIIDLTKEDDYESEHPLDLSNHRDRKFLGKLTYWAITHGRSVETMSADDWERMKKK